MIQIKRMPIKFLKNLDTNILVQPTLIHAVDVIDIVTPTLSITNVQKLPSNQNIFIENPFQTPLKKRKKLLL
jgi:hypothetical protein